MSNSLLLAGSLELLGGAGGTYNVLDGQRNFGDPQAVTQTVKAQLTMGSYVTGAFTDNRTIQLQILIQAANRLALSQADSALRVIVNSTTPYTLQWSPDGGLPLMFDSFRGQVTTQWSGKYEHNLARIVTIEMLALPYGRSPIRRTITGSVTPPIQLGNFAQSTQYGYHDPDNIVWADPSTVPTPIVGTPYGIITSPAPVYGSGSMQLDLNWFRDRSGVNPNYNAGTYIDPVTISSKNLSSFTTVMITLAVTAYCPFGAAVWLTLGDSHGAQQTFAAATPAGIYPGSWCTANVNLGGATIDLTTVTSWALRINVSGGSTTWNISVFVNAITAFPAGASIASTLGGAVYLLPSVMGDIQAPASIEFDRGGATMSGVLCYRAPTGTSSTTPCLLGIVSNNATTVAPTTFAGTYRVILANANSTINAGTLTVTQKIGSTTVATTTVAVSQLAASNKWADGGDLTLPLIDTPTQASNTTYTFTYSQTATDLILADTRGFLVWIPTFTAADYVWIDEATAAGMGGVYAGNTSDRTTATSLLGLAGVQLAGAMSLDPGDNYLLGFALDGAPASVVISYYDRYLGERTAT